MINPARTIFIWLARYITNIIDHAPVDPNEKLRLQHFAVFVFLGGCIMGCYGAYSLAVGQILLFSFIFLSGTSLVFGWLLMCHLPLGLFVYRANALLFSSLLLYMLFIGGENGSKSLWMFTFPLIVYFLLGKVEGSLWSVGLLLAAMVLLLVPLPGLPPYGYGNEFLLRFATVYLGLSVMAFWYEAFRDQYRHGLETEKQRLKDIIAALPEDLSVKDSEGRYLLCNPAFQAMTGLEENQIIGQQGDLLSSPQQAENRGNHELPLPPTGAPCLRSHETGTLGEGKQAVYDTIKQSLKDQHGTVDITRIQQGEAEPLDNAKFSQDNTTVGSILLVDDDQMVRELGEIMLSSFGFKVFLAADGTEALEIFRQHQDDIGLVCCDLLMPGMDGWQTIAALRSIAPGIQIIMISGMGQPDQTTGVVYPEQPQAFLKKPYSLERLRDTVSQVLGVEVVAV